MKLELHQGLMRTVTKTPLLVVIFFFWAGAGSAQDLTSTLFKITGPGIGKPSYVLGTMHLGDSLVSSQLPKVHDFIVGCDQFSNEIDLTDNPQQMLLLSKLFLPSEASLDSLYSEKELAFLSNFLSEKMGPAAGMLLTMKPFWVMAAIMEVEASIQPKEILDYQLQIIAEEAGIELEPLETMQSQVEAIDRIPLTEQVDALISFVTDYDDQAAVLAEMTQAYAQGDLFKLQEIYDDGRFGSEMERLLIDERNHIMVEKILDAIEEGTSVFVAVGALHLTGDDGILKMLIEHGYSVDPVAL